MQTKRHRGPHSYRALPDSPSSTLPYLIPEVPDFPCHPDRRHGLESGDTDGCQLGFYPSKFCPTSKLAHQHHSDHPVRVLTPRRTLAATSDGCLCTALGDVSGQCQLHQVHFSILWKVEFPLPCGAQGQHLLGPIATHSLRRKKLTSRVNSGKEQEPGSPDRGRKPTLEGRPHVPRSKVPGDQSCLWFAGSRSYVVSPCITVRVLCPTAKEPVSPVHTQTILKTYYLPPTTPGPRAIPRQVSIPMFLRAVSLPSIPLYFFKLMFLSKAWLKLYLFCEAFPNLQNSWAFPFFRPSTWSATLCVCPQVLPLPSLI